MIINTMSMSVGGGILVCLHGCAYMGVSTWVCLHGCAYIGVSTWVCLYQHIVLAGSHARRGSLLIYSLLLFLVGVVYWEPQEAPQTLTLHQRLEEALLTKRRGFCTPGGGDFTWALLPDDVITAGRHTTNRNGPTPHSVRDRVGRRLT